jgi:F-type H+-transporting ATPase subunit gamma
LPEFVRQSLDHAYLNSVTSENAARQAAMARASDNAAQIVNDLVQRYSRLRQDSITSEMLELAAAR